MHTSYEKYVTAYRYSNEMLLLAVTQIYLYIYMYVFASCQLCLWSAWHLLGRPTLCWSFSQSLECTPVLTGQHLWLSVCLMGALKCSFHAHLPHICLLRICGVGVKWQLAGKPQNLLTISTICSVWLRLDFVHFGGYEFVCMAECVCVTECGL